VLPLADGCIVDQSQNSGSFLHGGATASLVDLVGSAVFYTAGAQTRGSPLEMNISYLDAAFSDVSDFLNELGVNAWRVINLNGVFSLCFLLIIPMTQLLYHNRMLVCCA
jgi:hypothetical protein